MDEIQTITSTHQTSEDSSKANVVQNKSLGQVGFPKYLKDLVADPIGRAIEDGLTAIFPTRCSICQQWTELESSRFAVCIRCYQKMRSDDHNCHRCSAPLPDSVPILEDCPHCRKEKWVFQRAFCLGTYEDLLRTAVILMKRPYFESLSLGLGRALAVSIRTRMDCSYDAIIPTPQHWIKRVLSRNNSSELIAESISTNLHFPYKRTWLRRVRATKKQGMLGAEQRRSNVRNAFALSPMARVKNRKILLVDDILTSGSTANEMARVLLDAGANRVDLAAVARSLG